MRLIDADAVCERCRASGAICTGKDCEIPNMPTLTPPNEPLTPCDVCMYNPPSSMGGKPCYICPASPLEGEANA